MWVRYPWGLQEDETTRAVEFVAWCIDRQWDRVVGRGERRRDWTFVVTQVSRCFASRVLTVLSGALYSISEPTVIVISLCVRIG